jgi:hypothetical protein
MRIIGQARKKYSAVFHSGTLDFAAMLVRSVFLPSIGFEQQNG